MSAPGRKAVGKTVTAEEALYNLQQIDELLNSDSGDDQATIANYLKSDQDLTAVLRRHDDELHELCDRFIQAHVDQAESICSVYHSFLACEDQLVDFETEIVSFQRKLDEVANDVVLMQQQTDLLVRSVTNRRQVSNKINEVYDALQECDAFCEEMANKDVDMSYLSNLRELEHKMAFLSKNKALQHSAVDNEVRPKLTAAAHKAGDKLQRFLSRKISSLANDLASLEEQQLLLEQSGQFAFSFLQSYNQPVAKELVKLYVRTMADVFSKSFRSLLHDFSEASEIHANPLEPIVSLEELTEVISNRDSGAPQGNQVTVPPATGFPGRTIARRERSVSQHMRGLTDMLTTTTAAAAPLRSLREATFEDTIKAVSSISVRHGKLQADPAAASQLDQCNSWTWQFAKCIQTLVNTCVAECRFIGNFFCLVDDRSSDVSENFNDSEKIARAVLGKALSAVETSIQEDVPMVMERTSVLATLRVIEMAKQFLCTSQDPVPLMLLSGVLEMSKASLKNNLRTALKNDQAALAYLGSVKLVPFRQAAPLRASTAKLLESRAYAATLGPHPLLLRVGELLGQLELLNNASFAGALFSRAGDGAATPVTRQAAVAGSGGGSTAASRSRSVSPASEGKAGGPLAAPVPNASSSATAYDPFVASFLDSALASLLAFTKLLARRHTSTLACRVFSSVNTFCVLTSWTGMAVRYLGNAPTSRRVSIQTPTTGRDEEDLPRGSAPSSAVAARGSPAASAAAANETMLTALSTAHLQVLDDHLGTSLSSWVDTDADVNDTFSFLFKFVREMESALGTDFFMPGEQQEQLPVRPEALPPTLSSAKTLELASQFNNVWLERLRTVTASTGKIIQMTLGAVPAGRSSGALVQQRCDELQQRVSRVYLQAVADANAKLIAFASTVYGGHNDLQAKLVSNTTVLHEVKKSLRA